MATHYIVGLSGGKDSTAMALRLQEAEPRPYIYICTPTGDELPEMIEHWARLEGLLDAPIHHIRPDFDLNGLIEKEKMIPNWRARFCTRKLKIVPCQEYLDSLDGDKVLCVGLRADEEGREGGIYNNVKVDFPFRRWNWGIDEVMGYLDDRGVKIPARTDCARCFFQTLPEWWVLWKEHPAIYQDAVEQEQRFGHTFRSKSRDTWPASLAELRDEFDRGRMPRGLSLHEDMFGLRANQCRVCSL